MHSAVFTPDEESVVSSVADITVQIHSFSFPLESSSEEQSDITYETAALINALKASALSLY